MKKILVIDDEDSVRRTLALILRKQGYVALEAAGGKEGLGLAQAESPDLVLSDVNMADVDGFEVLRALRSHAATSAIPVILMTGVPASGGARASMEQGADDYLPKPFESERLLTAIRARLNRQESIRAQAQANEARLQEILSASQDLVAIAEGERLRLVYLNLAGRRMLGLGEQEDLSELSWTDFSTSQPHTALAQKMGRAKEQGAWIGETELRGRTGRFIPVSKQILAHPSHDGKAAFISVVARDITERKAAEAALSHERDLLQSLMDNLPECIYFKDTDSRFTRVNAAQARLLGVNSPQDALGKSDADFFPVQFSRQTMVNEQLLFVTGEPAVNNLEELRAGQGRTLWISSTKAPLRDSAGNITGLVGISRDVTEQRLMEVQLRQAQKLEAIGQLSAGIAHEINTPTQYVGDNTRFIKDSFASLQRMLKSHQELLQAVKSGLPTADLVLSVEQAAADEDLDYLFEQIPSAINETLEGVERITKIVRAMKEFSHPGGKEKALADLNKAIESTVTVARNEWKYVAEMQLDLAPGLPAVPCFLGEFNQAILNLVINAAHAIGDVVKQKPGSKGTITVQTRRDTEHVEVRVSDTGTGIPEAVRPRIFEPFFTTKMVGKGTGQGLPMVYGSIVKRHGGTVTFESETGKGTTFIIRLPLSPHAVSAEPAAPVAAGRVVEAS